MGTATVIGPSTVLRPTGERTALVSACLIGMRTRYDGTDAADPSVLRLADTIELVPICPEIMGGLPTPRTPSSISTGDGHSVLDGRSRVVAADGRDVTDAYLAGAGRVLAEVKRLIASGRAPEAAYLKDRSPACGGLCIKRDGRNVPGQGVCAAALARAGIKIIAV